VGKRPEKVIVALDGVGVYVHSSNPIRRLTVDQLAKILSGQIANWSELGGADKAIHIYNRNTKSGTRTWMRDNVLKERSFAKQARDVSSTELLTAAVSRNPNAIGYGGIAYARGARIVRISKDDTSEAYWPTRENVTSGKYPLSRPLHYYLNPQTVDQSVRDYVKWVLGDQGQKAVVFVGYHPAPRHADVGPDPDENLNPIVKAEAIRLTPQTMKRRGLTILVNLTPPSDNHDKAQVTVRLLPGPDILQRMRTFSLRIGDEIELPLKLDKTGRVSFHAKPESLRQISLYMVEKGAPDDGLTFLAPLGEFIQQD